MEFSPLLAIVTSPEEMEDVNAIAQALGYQQAEIVEGSPADAAGRLREGRYSPRYIIIYIGERSHDILPEIDMLAEQCQAGTKVVVIGATNDIRFYRAIIDRGVSEYFNYPTPFDEIRNALLQSDMASNATGQIISCMGGSSGDGSSMVALNVGYLLAKEHQKKVVLVDLDYQFGMIARQLELQPTYGTKEIFEHPERGVDGTLISRMVVHYRDGLDIITSPQSLHFMPHIEPELIREFVNHLASNYEYVILDLPHRWNHWISATIGFSDRVILVAQLLLKSITHCSRLLNTWTDLGFGNKPISIVINRSGSRYKEALHPKDFERILGHSIDHYLPNDIKTICQSENRGIPVDAVGKSQLANELQKIARQIAEQADVR